MHVFVELWSPKSSWLSMTPADRRALMARLGELTTPIIQSGSIDVLGWGKSDPKVNDPEGHRYFAVWRAPTRDALDRLHAAIVSGGWYEHFDQVNVIGELETPEAVIGEHLSM